MKPRRGPRHAPLVLAIAVATMAIASSPAPARAQPTGTTPPPRRVVSVEIQGPADETPVLAATIRELLARLQLTTGGRGSASATVLAAVDVTIDGAGAAHVTVRSADGAIVVDRMIPRDANIAIQREQIAHAVHGAAEAELLIDEDRVAGSAAPVPEPPPDAAPPPAEPEPPTPPPSPEPAKPAPVTVPDHDRTRAPAEGRGLALDLSTLVGGGVVGDGAGLVARVGGTVTFASRRGLRPAITLGAFYAFPFSSGDDTVTSRSSLVSVRAMPSIEVLRRLPFAFEVSAGGGIDSLSVEPSSPTLPASALGAASTRIDPVVSGAVAARFAIASDVTLTLTLLGDVDLATRRYVFDDRGRQTSILSPWTVRPTLFAGLSFPVLGETPYRSARTR